MVELKEWDRLTKHADSSRRPSAERSEIFELLSAAYGYAVIALYRLGHLDLVHLADERSRTAAAHGADPLRAAAAEWNHSLILLFDGSYAAGLRSTDRAGQLAEASTDPAARGGAQGAIHLRAAILAARAADRDRAQAHLDFAQALVAIHRVAVPVELADGTSAVHRAATSRLPAQTAPSREGHYWIDLSRGWLMHGDRQQALDCLHQARRIAPQLTRYHPQVRQVVQTLAAQDARSTKTLAGFAAWCGINT